MKDNDFLKPPTNKEDVDYCWQQMQKIGARKQKKMKKEMAKQSSKFSLNNFSLYALGLIAIIVGILGVYGLWHVFLFVISEIGKAWRG